jgi:excisionase family DNA binding protein
VTDEYLTTRQLADLLQVSAENVVYWRRKRTGPPHIKVGKHIRYDRADIDAWLAEHQVPTTR